MAQGASNAPAPDVAARPSHHAFVTAPGGGRHEFAPLYPIWGMRRKTPRLMIDSRTGMRWVITGG